jgi:hypothetical protein
MVVGLALLLKWERIEALVVVLVTVAFVSSIGVRSIPFVALINCCRWLASPSPGP